MSLPDDMPRDEVAFRGGVHMLIESPWDDEDDYEQDNKGDDGPDDLWGTFTGGGEHGHGRSLSPTRIGRRDHLTGAEGVTGGGGGGGVSSSSSSSSSSASNNTTKKRRSRFALVTVTETVDPYGFIFEVAV